MLDHQLEHIVMQARAAGAPDLADLPLHAARAVYRQILAAADVPAADVEVHDIHDGGTHGGVTLRAYVPRSAGPHPVVVYYHGGGYVLGDIDGYDAVCRRLCADGGFAVASIAYRQPPEHPWPAPVADALAGARWVARHAGRFGGDGTRLALAGDSAGAALATSVARHLRDEGGPAVSGQALIYPPAAGGHPGDYPSHQRHADGPTLTLRTMAYFSRHAFGPEGRAPDEDGAPLRARDLRGLPPALVMLAAHDPLRDEGVAYAEALRRAGNAVTLVEYHGLAHGFISMGGGVAAARLAQRQLADWLRQALGLPDQGASASR